MSVHSVKYYDVQRVLDRMASRNSFRPRTSHSAIPDLSYNPSKLDRMREYTSALSPKTARNFYTPGLSAMQSVKPKHSKSPTPTLSKPHKQAKSMSTEIYCGPCSRDNFYHEAAGYCVECSEYFCETCIKHHKNLKITKYHTVKDRRNMPKVKHYIQEDETVEICDLHLGELLRYFCKNHDEPCCSICATLDHRQCDKLVYIPEIEAKQTNKNCLTMIKRMTSLTNQFAEVKEGTEKCIKSLEVHKSDHDKKITKIRQDILDLLHALETDATRNMENLYEDEKGFLTSRIEACNEAIRALQTATSNLDMAKQNGIESKIFLQMKKLSKQVSHYELFLADVKRKNSAPLKFSFKPDPKIKEFTKSTEVLGSIEIQKKPPRTATLLTQFYVKSQGDKYQVCDITGSCILPDGRIVLADMYNENLKVADSNFHLVTQTKLSSEPWDICAISDDQIIVSLPREKKLQYFTISSTIHPAKKIGASVPSVKNSQYYGVAYHQDKLYVTCPKDDPPNIKILDMQGAQLREIAATSQDQEQSLFSDPLYIVVRHDGKMVYVSDSGNQSIITVDLKKDGTNTEYAMPLANPPGGITSQIEGDIYICGFKTNSIHVMNKQGEFQDEIIGSEGGLYSPQSMAYSGTTKLLIVTMQKSDMVKVFRIS
ncbi:E3 ubiquitin-protein ligase TRIM71-like [Mercenaria mercenaria]|uniref:E3 ubiquitin-protein ligase TRIM71-like n=1 Tax=Mercenaria mercenaria TaxID=6596 RepID=UPI00234F2C25|nr:E3 ubiquitin-protein ligase TRIM71-like [Mercenaria mercenaria]